MTETISWRQCAHGHRFAVVVESMPAAYTCQCPGCGTITVTEIPEPNGSLKPVREILGSYVSDLRERSI